MALRRGKPHLLDGFVGRIDNKSASTWMSVHSLANGTLLIIPSLAKAAQTQAKSRAGDDGKTVMKYEDVHAARAADTNLDFLEGIIPAPQFINKGDNPASNA